MLPESIFKLGPTVDHSSFFVLVIHLYNNNNNNSNSNCNIHHYLDEIPKEICQVKSKTALMVIRKLMFLVPHIGFVLSFQVVMYIHLFNWTEQCAKCDSEFLAPDGPY
jgi:hypothetical protein